MAKVIYLGKLTAKVNYQLVDFWKHVEILHVSKSQIPYGIWRTQG
jgi:hypothetical protein